MRTSGVKGQGTTGAHASTCRRKAAIPARRPRGIDERPGQPLRPPSRSLRGRLDAPMSGGGLFRAQARLQVPATLDVAKLREDLEHIANDLMVDLTLAPASPGETA